jgi:hypothetical protein
MSLYFCADCKSKMAVAALQHFRIGSYGKTNESETKNLLEPKHQLSFFSNKKSKLFAFIGPYVKNV